MLDTDTKRRIDTARDILVGKVPDPKSQVEQITIALIYKFMDDMDAEFEELGGKSKFFGGDFARYGWAKLLRSGLSGHETLGLYAEGITKMTENPGLPELFRDIFKNAFLPYRDPETLKAFLKIIDEFTYDHSEKLGDAFEYLLSVLGSQGDAGQFRTPRHIIDFMVEVVAPMKNETILDPACGTAGFLVSAYKYILRENSSETQKKQAEAAKAKKPAEERINTSSLNGASGDLLTPDERGQLAKNFKGYDISPDMVRLSLVNLYLHGFNDPHIYEYDTLTSEERWNEFVDVILANPPFMSPKGGIKPHQRFSIQSKRSEVLFVDYMAEHLSPTGRAGIIVPEGIIFQSQTAYKDLRRKLIDECLVAVVSLPAGCFNPYSGVKTSILIFDKTIARNSSTVGFFKVENDGFGLGAQRRPIDKNDLPQVKRELEAYLHAIRNKESTEDLKLHSGLIVEKERIKEGGECNLSGERYKDSTHSISDYSYLSIGEISEVITKGTTPTTAGYRFEESGVSFIKIESISENGRINLSKLAYISDDAHAALKRSQLTINDVLFSIAGAMGRTAVVDANILPANTNQALAIIRLKQERASPLYVSHLLRSSQILEHVESIKAGVAQYNLSLKQIGKIKIPLPPLEIQKEIVAEIEGYQKVIDGARAVLDNYRPHIPIHPDWPMVELGEVLQKSGNTIQPESLEGPITYIGLENITQVTGEICGQTISKNPNEIKSLKNRFNSGEILYGKLRPNLNKVWLADRSGICSTDIFVIQPKKTSVAIGFYSVFMRSESFNNTVMSFIKGAQLPRIGWSSFASIKIPLPPLETQQTIVAEIEAEQALVNANRELIERMEKKIEATLARVWGEETDATTPKRKEA